MVLTVTVLGGKVWRRSRRDDSKSDAVNRKRGALSMRSVIALVACLILSGGGFAVPAFATGGAAATSTGMKVLSIPPLEAKKLIETREGLQLVDVRSLQEYQNGALPDSKLVPWSSWATKDFLSKMEAFDKNKPLLLVCGVGARSWAAANLLSRAGFREIYNLNGGLQAWAMQRVPLPQKRAVSSQ
jgi:rhodanese-related sulfurtransferase